MYIYILRGKKKKEKSSSTTGYIRCHRTRVPKLQGLTSRRRCEHWDAEHIFGGDTLEPTNQPVAVFGESFFEYYGN